MARAHSQKTLDALRLIKSGSSVRGACLVTGAYQNRVWLVLARFKRVGEPSTDVIRVAARALLYLNSEPGHSS